MSILPQDIKNKRILISPLDWGMGHTTRCVPLIRQLMENNTIIFAGNQTQVDFMTREFPGQKTTLVEGYNVTLDSTRSSYLQLFRQFQKIKNSMVREQKFAEALCELEKIDIVISDNRYGFRSKHTTNIFLSHQLNLQLPIAKRLVNNRLKKWIEKFDQCWVPDDMAKPVCGDLVKAKLKIPVTFIGHLARFKKEKTGIKYKLIGILSGPEPERWRFASLLEHTLKKHAGKMAMIGCSGSSASIDFFENPSTEELQTLLNQSEKVISRAGYTTIMEMLALEKEALLVPTPGQYEQEYLARTVSDKNLTFVDEKRFFDDDFIVS